MNIDAIDFPDPYTKQAKDKQIEIVVVTKSAFQDLKDNLLEHDKKILNNRGFDGSSGKKGEIVYDAVLARLYLGAGDKISLNDGASAQKYLQKSLSRQTLSGTTFFFKEDHLGEDELVKLTLGWGLATIQPEKSKKDRRDRDYPRLVLASSLNIEDVQPLFQGVSIARTLINIPANKLGPEELVDFANDMAAYTGGKFKAIKDKDLIKKNFPMIYAVGDSSHRRPALIDMRWPNKGAPKVTLVGKGVVFDTGGLDLKPPVAMRRMKKDMGGAAQTLGLAWALVKSGANIDLRVLIPAVENAVSSEAFRPGDVFDTRKGLTVEIADTDAEGRLVLSDALTYACEDKPDLLIDFATLTGAARVALGTRIGALFGSIEETTRILQSLSIAEEDPLWTLPLWEEYREEMDSQVSDMENIGSGKAGAIHGGLFLESFVDKDVDWLHLDVYAWEDSGRPAFEKGGMDQGLRAVYALLKQRY